MNSRDSYAVLREKKTAEIEAVLRNYLPQKEGCQKIIMDAVSSLPPSGYIPSPPL